MLNIEQRAPRFLAAVSLLVLLLVGTRAFSHVTLEQGEAQAGSHYKAVLRVTHGCEGSITEKVTVDIPEGVISVKPMPKPGWQVKTMTGAYSQTYAFHGHDVSEGVKQVVWGGGQLPDDYYDEFAFFAYLTPELKPGETLYFKVVQTCASGEMAWAEVPVAGSGKKLEWPAPGLKILPEVHDHHEH